MIIPAVFSNNILIVFLSLYLSLNALCIAPPGINVLEHESIALDMPNSYSTFHPPNTYSSKNISVHTPSVDPTPPSQTFTLSFTPIVQPRELPRQRLPESFNQVTGLSSAFSLRSESAVSLYRARMENRNVVLRVLNGKWVKLSLTLSLKFFAVNFQDRAFVAAVFFSVTSIYHSYPLQTLLMLQKDTTSLV